MTRTAAFLTGVKPSLAAAPRLLEAVIDDHTRNIWTPGRTFRCLLSDGRPDSCEASPIGAIDP